MITDIVYLRYRNFKVDITKHIYLIAAKMEQIKEMKTFVYDAVQIGMLIASIEVFAFPLWLQLSKTLTEEDITWETVRYRLIEEWQSLNPVTSEHWKVGKNICSYWNRPDHSSENCWINPANPSNVHGICAMNLNGKRWSQKTTRGAKILQLEVMKIKRVINRIIKFIIITIA